MRLLIDANIILDVLIKREPCFKDSSVVWKLCEIKKAEGYITTLTFANLVYIMRKELEPGTIEEVREKMSLIFKFADFSEADLVSASKMKWGDFEDAVQSAVAKRLHADFIVTRNIRDYKESAVKALTPAELIKWAEKEIMK